MAFFQNSVLKKHLSGQNTETLKAAYQKFSAYFHHPAIQQNIRDAKEEQFQEGFLRELFVEILGYTLNPQPNFNLTTELKNEKGSKKADGAIFDNNGLKPKVIAVIELKGTDTKDLDKINVQAFNYKNNQTGCVYVITSNFEKLRFFIHHSVEHIEFNLFTLTESEFQLLWLCLSAENLLNGVPLKVKEESLLEDEKITKHLYKDYAAFRNDMWHNMVKNNANEDKLLLFKKTQKLLDRYLFIFFAEDSGLLPPNSISRIVKRWEVLKEEDAYKPLYDIFKQYFGYIDTGRKGQKSVDDIFAYNGGLFQPDELLDNIVLDDEMLHPHVMKLTNYDFQSEVDVNILGHIFENSLNEIENITAQLEGQEIDKSKTKRKKDGVFYTPKYITKYIVENTVGKLCEEKKAELEIIDEEYAKGRRNRKNDIIKNLDDNLQAYRNWLLNITICDPACGSGAFLNQALEFLMEEHAYIDELQAQLFGASIVFKDVSNHILEKNIFGVDINNESVDIAKLSLWLRTAQRGRKLTTLNNNIKCGNSLIDDPIVAGDKAFNWQEEFPTVFQKKEKNAFHITWVTHNSRTSQRMIDYKVKKGEAFWLEDEYEKIVASTISDIVEQDDLNLMAFNSCGDHIHLLLVCEEVEIPNIIRKMKGKSSQKLKEYLQIPKEETFTLWAQKYSTTYINSEEQVWNTVEYIRNNRIKHELHIHNDLQLIADHGTMQQPYEQAFRTEYKGGFDAVIGNPPYVQLQKLKELSNQLKGIGYKTFESTGDLYCLFYEKGNIILKLNGVLGFITSNKWMRANYGKSLRQYFLQNTTPYQLWDLGAGIFEAAVVDSNLILFKKQKSLNISIPSIDLSKEKSVIDFSLYSDNFVEIQPKNDEVWSISSLAEQNIKSKVEKNGVPLKKWNIDINYGIKTGLNEAFIIDEITRKKLIIEDAKNADIIVPVLRGRDVKRYQIDYQNLYLINTHNGYKDIPRVDLNQYPSIKRYLDQFEPQLSKRYDKGETSYNLRNCAYVEDFNSPNIFYPDISNKLSFVLSNNKYSITNTGYFLRTDNKYLLTILNSNLINYYYKTISAQLGSTGLRSFTIYIENIPVPKINISNQLPFIEKSNSILKLNSEFQQIIIQFTQLLQSKFSIEKLSTKLQNWHELKFGEFLKELNKAKVQMSLREEAEWMQYLNEQKQKAQTLKSEINRVDAEIDQMVYQLYELTEEEIKIVEEN